MQTTQTITRLSDDAIASIAAGEVVTSPASVVKELVENSLDADADRVDVSVAGGGTERIRVADDGHGLTAHDARLALDRHTTSKIADAADVDRVETLGFRGEALPSIAAVSRLALTTKTRGDGARGTRVTVADDDPEAEPAGRGVGTTVTVRDLFYNRPARRKSLASPRREFSKVSEVVTRYALLHPEVRFSLGHDGREVFATAGSGSYADAALGVYDRTVASRSVEFDSRDSAADGDADTLGVGTGPDESVSVRGLAAYPSITRAKPSHVYVAVNGRALRDSTLREAVRAGYGTLLPSDRYPVAVVDVQVPPAAVDVNVHPAKETVAFADGERVADAVERTVREALSTEDLVRSGEVALDLDGALAPVDGSAFGDVTVIGQFRELYLLCEDGDDLLVVDQHAAHERVNYERLRAALGEVESVPLDPPETVTLSPETAAVADAHREDLAALGFDLTPFGGGSYRLSAVPAPLGRAADVDALRDVLDTLSAGETPENVREDLLKDLACHPSLKAGDTLTPEAGETLLDRLGACEQPYACPHGRPTVLSIDEASLVRGFGRENTRLG